MCQLVKVFDPIKPWFHAAEECGEYIGIRFGRLPVGATEPEWIFLKHTDVDGIGGFADILRKRGIPLPSLPQIKHPCPPSRLAVLKTIPKFLKPRRKLQWASINGATRVSTNTEAPTAVAWHVFDEAQTTDIRRVCRKTCVTVNSFLLKNLSKAIRPFLADHSATIPWMVPINIRGKVNRHPDTENHTTFVSVGVRSFDTVHDVHRNVYEALARGDHWANWFAYDSSRVLTAGMRRLLIRTEKYMSQWHIGAFSNLGDWDREKEWKQPNVTGDWLFCPPVLRCQHLGAGCVTFQNRLSIMIQAHPELTTAVDTPKAWVHNWVKEIEIDLASVLADPVRS